jgi:hypothetical protein
MASACERSKRIGGQDGEVERLAFGDATAAPSPTDMRQQRGSEHPRIVAMPMGASRRKQRSMRPS